MENCSELMEANDEAIGKGMVSLYYRVRSPMLSRARRIEISLDRHVPGIVRDTSGAYALRRVLQCRV